MSFNTNMLDHGLVLLFIFVASPPHTHTEENNLMSTLAFLNNGQVELLLE